MLYQHILVLDANKVRFENDSCYDLIGEKSLDTANSIKVVPKSQNRKTAKLQPLNSTEKHVGPNCLKFDYFAFMLPQCFVLLIYVTTHTVHTAPKGVRYL